MNTYRTNAIVAGGLLLMGSVFGILGGVIGGEVLASLIAGRALGGADLMSLVAAQSSRLTAGAFLTLLMGLSLSLMTIFLYPVLRKDCEELAMGLVLFRGALEGVSYLVTTLGILTLVALGNADVVAGSGSAVLQSLGQVLYQFQDLKAPIGTIVFLIGATCLYLSLYRSRLIPRWLTIWGLIGVVPYMAYGLLHFFHLDTGYGLYLQMVLAPQELVMAAWLVVKGFNPAAVAALSNRKEARGAGAPAWAG